ncbi:unnamed protein product, partial [Discosporangium mesarthrocarpum]
GEEDSVETALEDSEEAGEEDSQGGQGTEWHKQEQAVSMFIEGVGGRLREHGDKERHESGQSLNEFSTLLRSLGSIGCEVDPCNGLGLTVLVWVLFQLIDVWADRDNSFNYLSYDEITRVCNQGKVPLLDLLGEGVNGLDGRDRA